MDIIQVPLNQAKESLMEYIKNLTKEDYLKFSSVWIKEKGEERCLKSVTIDIIKGGRQNGKSV